MNPTVNPMFAKFDQVLGKTTPTTNTPPVTSRADEIRALAKSSTPVPEKTQGQMLAESPVGQAVSGVAQTYSELPGKIGSDIQEAASDIQKGDVFKGVAKAGLRTAGDVAGAVFAPIGGAVSVVKDALFGMFPSLRGASETVINGIADHISNIPAVQKLAMEHPNAGEDFQRGLNLIMSSADTGKIEPARMTTEAGALPGKVSDLAGKASDAAIMGTEMAKSTAGDILQGAKDKVTSLGESMLKGKTKEQILATPEADVFKLSPSERKVYFENAQSKIEETRSATEQKIQRDLEQKMLDNQKEAENLQRELSVASRDEVVRLRPKIREAMGKQSQEYRRLVDEEISPVKDTQIDAADLKSFIESKYPENPDQAKAILNRLGMDKLTPEARTTIGKIYDNTVSLKQDIGTASKKGTRAFTPDEKLTDDTVSSLVDFLKSQGVDLKNARSFWAKYAPVRNQLMTEAKPFLQTPIQTKTFANTLTRVAKGTDVNNENFISEVENILGEKIGTESKSVVQKLSANEKQALVDKAESELKKADNELRAERASKKLDETEFEINRQARFRDIIKKVIFGVVVGGAGVGIEEGIRRTVFH